MQVFAVFHAVACAFLLISTRHCEAAPPPQSALDRFVADCSAMNSDVVLPGSPNYHNATEMFLALFNQRTPLLVLYATNEASVIRAVAFANQYSIKLSARSGGNSNLGWGTCDGCLVVDVSRMTSVTVDSVALQATIGPGVSNRMLVDQVSTLGLALPQGDCPMVRVGGYTVGGGLTLTARTLGLNIDALIEMRVVGPDGSVHVANNRENPDLFWALRGGSGINFGIVTALTFQAKPIPSKILGGHMSFAMTPTNTHNVAALMYDIIWGAGDPEAHWPFGFSLAWAPADDGHGGTDFKVMGLWFSENITLGRSLLDQFAALPGLKSNNITEGTFYEVMQPLMDQYLTFGGLNWTMPDAMIAKPSSRASFTSFITTVTNAALEQPPASLIAWVFAPLGGRVNSFPVDHTAFPHRTSGGNFHMPTVWFNPAQSETVRAFGQDSLHLTRQWWVPTANASNPDPPSYVNHPSEYLIDYQTSYWGPNLPRLQQIKRQYDPRNFMSNGQGIIATTSGGANGSVIGGSDTSLGGGAIAGIIIAVIIALLAIVGVVHFMKKRGASNVTSEDVSATGYASSLSSQLLRDDHAL